ncbi:MAG: UbiA-like polyprenyltransferase, partial [Micromonosporaceae bacterium]
MTGTDAGNPGPVRAFLRLVAFEHSVFALPFAYLAALTAMKLTPPAQPNLGAPEPGTIRAVVGVRAGPAGWIDWDVLLLITVAMVGARTFAMAANRIIDRRIDAQNPRTAGRELVTGVVSVRTAWWGAGVALVVFLAAAAALNPLCLALAPLAVIPLVVYPYAKRFTDYPHAILGLAQAIGPMGGWLAVTGTFDGALPAVLL